MPRKSSKRSRDQADAFSKRKPEVGFDGSGPTIYTPTERELVRSLVLESYADFVKEMWDTVVSDPLIWGPHMDFLCAEAQAVAERVLAREEKLYDLVVNVPPGSSKSTIFTIMLTPWLWARDPSIACLNYSFNDALALDLSLRCKDVIESEKYQELFGPSFELRADQKAKSAFGTDQGGLRFACGAGGMVTGRHGHIQVIDDPLDPQNAVSQTVTATINRWISNTLPSRCKNKEVTPTILVMQRVSQGDPSAHMLGREGGYPVRHICLPASIDTDAKKARVSPPEALRLYQKDLLDPKRMSEKVLAGMKASMTPYDFACQFDQDSVPQEGGMFRTDQIATRILDMIEWPKVRQCVRFWDKAASQGKGCYTVGTLMLKYHDGRFIIADVCRGQWEPFSRDARLKEVTEADHMDGHSVPVRIEEEGGASGKFDILSSVRMLAGYDVKGVRPQGDKESRAAPFAAQVNGGNVWMVRGSWNKAYLEELMYFPNSAYRDQVDTSSGGFNELTAGFRAGTF